MRKKSLFLALLFLLFLSQGFSLELPVGVKKLIDYQNSLAGKVNFLIAFIAGLLSFTSPCGFAIMPVFFSFGFKDRKESVNMTVAFSLGLILAFSVFGVLAGLLGEFFNSFKLNFSIIAGLVMIFLGVLTFLGKGFSGFELNKSLSERRKSFFGLFSLGFVFGAAWTPCVGPVLTGILLLGTQTGSILSSTFLLIAYALGTVTPLILIALFVDKQEVPKLNFGKKTFKIRIGKKVFETHMFNFASGILLIFLGLIIILYRGTFFFQTDFTKYVPMSMSFWSEVNSVLVSNDFFQNSVFNTVFILLSIIFILFFSKKALKRIKK